MLNVVVRRNGASKRV